MIRTHSLLVILPIFSVRLASYISYQLSSQGRGTSIVATESYVPHTTWNGLIKNHLVDL